MSVVPTWIILVAGGSGIRMGSDVPKQFLLLAGKPVIIHALNRMCDALPHAKVMVVLPEQHQKSWLDITRKFRIHTDVKVCIGGDTRFHSVKNALDAIPDESGLVAIHDAVRPLVPVQVVRNAIETAATQGASVPVVPVHNSVRVLSGEGKSTIFNRESLRLVQTPQCFQLAPLKKAYNRPFEELFTDDASVWEAAGGGISIVAGHDANLKITRPEDLIIAEALLASGF